MKKGITINDVGETGTVDWWGEIYEGYMVLDSHSNINGHEAQDRKFVFYPFDSIEGWD